jgi:hypothetical protein
MKRDTRSQAERLGLKPKTLENWRCLGKGPPFIKLGDGPGASVVYDDDDVDAWLAARRRNSTCDRGQGEHAA